MGWGSDNIIYMGFLGGGTELIYAKDYVLGTESVLNIHELNQLFSVLYSATDYSAKSYDI